MRRWLRESAGISPAKHRRWLRGQELQARGFEQLLRGYVRPPPALGYDHALQFQRAVLRRRTFIGWNGLLGLDTAAQHTPAHALWLALEITFQLLECD